MQAAVKIVLEPVFEADFLPCSFGFRPRRSAHDALQVLIDECWRGRRWVVETDIASCFSAIPHEKLMQAVEERVCDQPVLKLLRAMLRAGVMEDGQVRRPVAGTPQGGVISARHVQRLPAPAGPGVGRRATGSWCGMPTTLVVMCWSRSQAEQALERLTGLLAGLGLEPKAAKTRIVHLEEGGEGFDFLGFHHRLVRSRGLNGKRPVTFLARWPADKAMQHARDRIRELTGRSRLLLSAGADRGGPEPVPARLGRLLPVRQLRGPLQQDQAATRGCGWRCSSASATAAAAAFGWSVLSPPVPGPARPDQPCRESSSHPGPSGTLAGKAECRR